MALVLGVDSSTQSCKTLLLESTTGEVVRSGRAAHPDGTEVDPAAWLDALHESIDEVGGLDQVAAWSIGGQQHGMVALDEHGNVLRDALLWNDTRSATSAADLVDELGAATWVARTGLVPVASFTVSKLRWLRDHEPEIAQRVAAVALPHDWLTWRLRGFGPERPELNELVTDRSDVSGTGYWNPKTGEYELELFERALGHRAILPRVLAAADHVTDDAGRLVAPGAGDNAAAALGVDASLGDVVVSIGTSGTVFAVSDQPTVDESGIIAGFASADGHYLPLVCTINASRVMSKTAELLGVDLDELSDLARSAAPGAGGLRLVPYFEGERTPNLPDATAELTGMTLESTTRSNLARASVEGMLSGLGAGLDALRDAGIPMERAILIGGGAKSRAVQEIAAEIFGLPIEVPEPGEYVALGAAKQAAGLVSTAA